MHDISPEALRLIERDAPTFITAVWHAKEGLHQGQEAATLLLTLDAFADDPILLYACLWYCATVGVTCTFAPNVTMPRIGVQHT